MAQASGSPVKDKFLRLMQNKDESIGSWETRIRNQALQCEYENFADEFMQDQFIAGLTSETLSVKLIGKGHRHRDAAQTKDKLREVVEIAKSFEKTTFANQLMRTVRSTHREQVNFMNKSTRENQTSAPPTPLCFWCRGAIQVLVNISALRLARDAISVESLVISLVHVKEEQESK